MFLVTFFFLFYYNISVAGHGRICGTYCVFLFFCHNIWGCNQECWGRWRCRCRGGSVAGDIFNSVPLVGHNRTFSRLA